MRPRDWLIILPLAAIPWLVIGLLWLWWCHANDQAQVEAEKASSAHVQQ